MFGPFKVFSKKFPSKGIDCSIYSYTKLFFLFISMNLSKETK